MTLERLAPHRLASQLRSSLALEVDREQLETYLRSAYAACVSLIDSVGAADPATRSRMQRIRDALATALREVKA